MILKIREKYWWIVLLAGATILGGWRFYPFLVQDIPLGYDPGLYKVMMEQYSSLLPHRIFTDLDTWIQKMYPPFLGVLTSLLSFIGISPEFLLTWGIGILSLCVGCALYFFLRQTTGNRTIATVGLLMYVSSFVQRFVVWWGYRKQLLASFLLLIILGLWSKYRFWISLPIVIALALTHRAGILFLIIVGIIYFLRHEFQYLRGKRAIHLWVLFALGFCVLVCTLPIYWPFLELQFGALRSRVLHTSIDLPNYSDGFQAGGTFLSTIDLLKTNWWVMLLGILSLLMISTKYTRNVLLGNNQKSIYLLVIALLIGTIRVFGQGFFFQRMMGYADLFWIAGSAIILGYVREKKRRGKIGVILFLLGHIRNYLSWGQKLRRPIIEASEFDFIKQITSITPDDAIIAVPGIMYSPWVAGWSGREMIAPGWFSLNIWGNTEPGWASHRWNQDSSGKCKALADDYGGLERPLYLREGSKTVYIDNEPVRSNIESDICFNLIASGEHPDWRFWSIDLSAYPSGN